MMIARVLLVLVLAAVALAVTPATQITALTTLYTNCNGPNWKFNAFSYPLGNNWNSGDPCAADHVWSGLSCDANSNIIAINLAGVGATGSLSNSLGTGLTNLVNINLSSNKFTGSLPVLTGWNNVVTCNLAFNSFSGTVGQLTSLTSVQTLSIQNNSFVGTIPPAFGQLLSLNTLNMQYNNLVGSLDNSVLPPALQVLQAHNNGFTGTLSFLGRLSLLTSVRLSYNKFSGYVPATIANLPFLVNLNLQYNKLTGQLPVAALTNNLVALTGLCLEGNSFFGPLPDLPQLMSSPGCGLGGNTGNTWQCPVPSTASGYSTTTCSYCVAGQAVAPGGKTCSYCAPGTYSSGTTACTACPAGTFSELVGAPAVSACQSCPKGFYSAAGSTSCDPCPAGTYSNTNGATSSASCLPCVSGFVALNQGQATCVSCPAGSYAAGSTVCLSSVEVASVAMLVALIVVLVILFVYQLCIGRRVMSITDHTLNERLVN